MGGWLSLVAFGEIGGQISWRVIGDAFVFTFLGLSRYFGISRTL